MRTGISLTRPRHLRSIAILAAIATAIGICAVHAPKAQAAIVTRAPVAAGTAPAVPMLAAGAAHPVLADNAVHVVLTSHEATAGTYVGNQCLSYASECISATDVINVITEISNAIAVWVTIILTNRGKQSGGKDNGDQTDEVSSGEAGEDFGDCLQAYGYNVEWMGCYSSGTGLEADTWILVPTGNSYALASQWYYEQEGTLEYMTAASLSSGAHVILANANYGGSDHYRVWWWTGEPLTPIATQSASTTAYRQGGRDTYWLTA